jgi:hypothetical protein
MEGSFSRAGVNLGKSATDTLAELARIARGKKFATKVDVSRFVITLL